MSVIEWTNKGNYIYIKYKRRYINGTVLSLEKGDHGICYNMDELEYIMLSEISQMQKKILYGLTCGIFFKKSEIWR